jgi:hypothetical protein
MCYDTLVPKYLLEDYINLVFKHKYLAITGSNKLGKTFLMRKIAQFISKQLVFVISSIGGLKRL